MSKPIPEKPGAIPRENPFRAIMKMIRTSVGRLPAHLVIIFVIALTLTVLCGAFLKILEVTEARNSAYLPERLSPESGKPALAENQLTGMWVTSVGDVAASLRLENGVFEIIARNRDATVTHYFIRGGYKTEGNVLIMQQRKDLGTPLDAAHFEYKYYPLEFKTINLYADIDDASMRWRIPEKEIVRVEDSESIARLIFGASTLWVKISATP